MNGAHASQDLAPQLGAFARIFPRSTAAEVADAFVSNGLVQVQLNLNAIGLPTIPDHEALAGIDLGKIRAEFEDRGRVIWGVSATYNVAHPDQKIRRESTATAAGYIRVLAESGAVAATLCTGSRDSENMWRAHRDNRSEAAWRDMRESLGVLLAAAAEADVLLAIEPEPGNVVAGTDEAVRLVEELGPDAARIGFILDPANLVSSWEVDDHPAVLRDAFERLGEKTICLHAKDTVSWAETLLGSGVVDYDLVLSLRSELPRSVPLIIQDATEEQIPALSALLHRAAAAET